MMGELAGGGERVRERCYASLRSRSSLLSIAFTSGLTMELLLRIKSSTLALPLSLFPSYSTTTLS